jgi:cytochrome c oxidase subunit 3
MATTLTPPKLPVEKPEHDPRRFSSTGGGGFGRGGRSGGDGNGGGGRDDSDPRALAVERYKLGTWIGLGGIVMIFAAFTSAMVVRSGISGDWRAFDLPSVLWLSTAILLASSFALEKAKGLMRQKLDAGLRRWMGITAALGGLFLILQYVGWTELAARGIYLASNPSSSFFYLLTAAHGVHLLGGVIAMSYVMYRIWRPAVWVTREAVVESTALYWHFMDGLWVYLVLLLAFWR